MASPLAMSSSALILQVLGAFSLLSLATAVLISSRKGGLSLMDGSVFAIFNPAARSCPHGVFHVQLLKVFGSFISDMRQPFVVWITIT